MKIEKIQEAIFKITQDKKKLILVVLCIFIILYLDFSLVLKPQAASLGAVNNKISKIKNGLKNLKTDLARMQASLNKPVALKTKKIISEDQVSWLIEELYKLGTLYNAKISQVRPIRETKPTPSPIARSLTLLLNLEISCGYHNLVKFLNALENHSVFMAIDELEIRRNEKDIFAQQVKLNLITYVAKK